MAITKKAPVKSAPSAAKVKKVAPVSEGTPLNAKLAARMKNDLGIVVTTEEEARKKLAVIFKANDVTEIDDEDSLADLIDMAGALPTGDGDPAPDDPEDEMADTEDEEDFPDAEGEEYLPDTDDEEDGDVVAAVAPKKPTTKKVVTSKKPKVEVDDDEEEEQADDLVEEVEVKQLKPVKQKKEKPAKKEKTGKTERSRKLLGKHWEFLTAAEKEKALKPFRKVLPEKNYNIQELQRSIIVKFNGSANEHNIFKYHLLRQLDNGKLEGIFVSHRFKTPDELQAYLPDGIESLNLRKGESCSYIHPFGQDMVLEMLADTDFLKESVARAAKQDTKMKNHREKLESALKVAKTTTPAKATKGKPKGVQVAVIPINEDDEEEEVEVPAKKKVVAKAVPVKKVVAAKAKKVAPKPVAKKVVPKPAAKKPVPKKKK